jgi:outer membrane protein assembly factor BamD (BamD/ComL family)
MLRYRIHFVVLILSFLLSTQSIVSAGTWRLEEGEDWEVLEGEGSKEFLLAVAKIKELVNTGQTKAARKAFAALKEDFPEIAGPDFDLFVKAEIYFCKGKLAKAVKTHEKLLTEYPGSRFRRAALEREFSIAKAFLSGKRKVVLGFIRMKRYAEGIKIMDKVTEWAGIDSPIGVNAAVAVAENYQQRKKYNDAYLKWWEISLEYQAGRYGRDALLGMAQCKQAVYNMHPEPERPFYDASCLSTAKSCYEKFKLLYVKDAEEIGVDEILNEINEQLGYKQYIIGRYYLSVGNKQAANLYYNMVVSDWPGTKAAELAKEMLVKNVDSSNSDKVPSEK